MNNDPSGQLGVKAFLLPVLFVSAFSIFLGTPASLAATATFLGTPGSLAGAAPSPGLAAGNTSSALNPHSQLAPANGSLVSSASPSPGLVNRIPTPGLNPHSQLPATSGTPASSPPSSSPPSSSSTSPSPDLVDGDTTFALDLYSQLATTSGNLFFSPYSISSALGMTYAGARGETAQQIQQALQFPLNQAQLPPAFKTLDTALLTDTAGGGRLNIANALVLTGGTLGQQYESLVQDQFGAEVFPGNLNAINAWVSQKTNGKISSILNSLDPHSVCVILNAVYFKGTWQNQFQTSSTYDSAFNLSATTQVTVPLMHQTANFRILTLGDFQALSMPYEGNQLSMVIALPKTVDGLPALEKELTTHDPHLWLSSLDQTSAQQVDVTIPKFNFQTNYDLVPQFKELGMTDAFLAGVADFSGMGWPKGKLFISKIKHAAFVDVNETSTEAAGATAVEMASYLCVAVPLRPPVVFRADHPFLFLIRDNSTGSILFLGRVVDPSSP